MKVKAFLKKTHIGDFPSLVGLVLLLIIGGLASNVFFSISNWANIMRQSVILGVCALGLTFVILTGNNDLSISGVMTMCCIIAALLITRVGLLPTILCCVLAGAAMGLITGTILSTWDMEPFVATYGMQTIGNGLAYLISGGAIVLISNMPRSCYNLVNAKVFNIPICFLVMIVLYFLCHLILTKTRFGRYVYAIGGNPEVCHLSGISVRLIRTAVYTICGTTAGIAGVFMLSRTTVGDPSCGGTYTLQAISACIIGGNKFNGGRGNVWFTLIGVLIVGIISNVLNLIGASYYVQLIVQGFITVAAVAVSSEKRKI